MVLRTQNRINESMNQSITHTTTNTKNKAKLSAMSVSSFVGDVRQTQGSDKPSGGSEILSHVPGDPFLRKFSKHLSRGCPRNDGLDGKISEHLRMDGHSNNSVAHQSYSETAQPLEFIGRIGC